MSSIAHTGMPCAILGFEADIAALGDALAALHALARSLPADVTVPLERREEFARLADTVDALFEQLALATAMTPA